MLSVKKREFLASITRTGAILGAIFLVLAAGIFPAPFEHIRLWARSHVRFFYEWALFPQDCIDDIQHKISTSLAISSENQRLRRESQTLNAERETSLQLQVENARLKALLHWSNIPSFGYVSGRVMGEEHGPYRHAVLMGWEGGSKPPAVGSVALDAYGLAGRVTEVSAQALRILLIDDKASHVPVVGKASGSHAILGGKGEEGGLELAYYAEGTPPEEGEVVETILKDGTISGIPVGRVHYEGKGRPTVLPFADLRHLSILRVIDYAPLIQAAPNYVDGKTHPPRKRKK